MIGCVDETGVTPSTSRYCETLRRATQGRPFEVQVSSGSHRLGESPSATAALELAERAGSSGPSGHPGQREIG